MVNQENCAEVLDAIEEMPDAFNMGYFHMQWALFPDQRTTTPYELPPDTSVPCGTTLCIAGWAARLAGWTLRGSIALKDGKVRGVDYVAQEVLELHDNETSIFYVSDEVALNRLRDMAGR